MLLFDAVDARAVGDIVIDGHRKGIRFLKDHPCALSQQGYVRLRRVDIFPVDQDVACDLTAFHEIIHAVERFQACGLPAAGGADKGGDLLFGNLHRQAFERVEIAVI